MFICFWSDVQKCLGIAPQPERHGFQATSPPGEGAFRRGRRVPEHLPPERVVAEGVHWLVPPQWRHSSPQSSRLFSRSPKSIAWPRLPSAPSPLHPVRLSAAPAHQRPPAVPPHHPDTNPVSSGWSKEKAESGSRNPVVNVAAVVGDSGAAAKARGAAAAQQQKEDRERLLAERREKAAAAASGTA